MGTYIVRRLFYMVITLLVTSLISFTIIQLPPGDYLTTYMEMLSRQGLDVSEEQIRSLETEYGLDLPFYAQYLKWLGKMLQGDLGRSFKFNKQVTTLLAERVPLTVAISTLTLIFVYVVAIPIGVYSATHQYSAGDYTVTVLGFAGLATPNFLLALVLMFVFFKFFGLSAGGLFSPEYIIAPWSLGKVWDLLKHLPIPIIVIGTAGTASIIRGDARLAARRAGPPVRDHGALQGGGRKQAAVQVPGQDGGETRSSAPSDGRCR